MVKLATTPYGKVWGSTQTEPWFPNPDGRKIGEVWFEALAGASARLPLLVKLLFTSDRLSVQVHPGDIYARKHENSRGKTEMWHVVRADPGSEVALGLVENITKTELRRVALSGEIEKLLNWIPAAAGDTFFVPAGTIHAIGGGLVLCEVQQHSDITYRLYDWGRPRELQLDRALDVALPQVYEGLAKSAQLTECQYFRTERVAVNGVVRCLPPATNTLYIALEGDGRIGAKPFQAGEAWEIEPGSEPFEIEGCSAVFLVTSEPGV